ncbi:MULTISPECIES: SRPBCC family protein [Rhizobium]|uniref:SRPBCC family protein n=1 Tax=Rhizobium rhododendri TaxID=2506430 RepID=A0ABY8IE56_9HYPH|nr:MULTISPECIES: SRPBCC family protein [Rhizobium]MBZ5758760.1 SRPBCC family protein [Rhizobium sp. VS19-DR96]MBZ5764410.1 SRPBCC family protein [Rhizobium sp. VS19-DR129.2]MBZ5771953.1 SRPBCC family protein [Rhizobium sp. VS19-DRK62.2]MBZ5783360.1 SRPBCC family protein [Rhizobium sp. VS19-DR121]MBZ5800808.1 SRPBCC family protein [Rhizobium sp. VS19-DR181]
MSEEDTVREADIVRHELSLTRVIAATPDKLFRAWTEPELLKQWFAPLPFRTTTAELDPRPGGTSFIVMLGPDGVEYPNRGVYLDVVENRKLVFTDAFTSAWIPSAKPFMTAIVTFEDIGNGQTRYTARALHWSAEDRETHENMGFYEGWGQCADQLASLVGTL